MANPMVAIQQRMMQQLSSSNPMIPGATSGQMQQIMNLVNQSGGDPQKAFYDLARQRGVDPQAVINFAKNLGYKF